MEGLMYLLEHKIISIVRKGNRRQVQGSVKKQFGSESPKKIWHHRRI